MKTVRAQVLPADTTVLHGQQTWSVVARNNQYPEYEIKRGWYLGPESRSGEHRGRTPGTHYIGKGAVSQVIVHLKRDDRNEVLRVEPDHQFEVVA